MNANDKVTKKGIELSRGSTSGGLISLAEVDNFFDDFLSRRWPRLLDRNFPVMGMEKDYPKVDIIDYKNEVEVQVALPGVKKEDLDVTINDQTITIRASTKEEKKEEGKYFRLEITRGEYQRTLSLPGYIDSDNAKATFKDGLLKVAIPKTEKGKRKSVEIK